MKSIFRESFLNTKKVYYKSGEFTVSSDHQDREDYLIKNKDGTWHSINSTLSHILKAMPPNKEFVIDKKHF